VRVMSKLIVCVCVYVCEVFVLAFDSVTTQEWVGE
jgi:hypothetical protein